MAFFMGPFQLFQRSSEAPAGVWAVWAEAEDVAAVAAVAAATWRTVHWCVAPRYPPYRRPPLSTPHSPYLSLTYMPGYRLGFRVQGLGVRG